MLLVIEEMPQGGALHLINQLIHGMYVMSII